MVEAISDDGERAEWAGERAGVGMGPKGWGNGGAGERGSCPGSAGLGPAGSGGTQASPGGAPRLLQRVRMALRVRHYSLRTEQAYVFWIRSFILYHQKRHPDEMGGQEIGQYLGHLAVEKEVAPSTQNQALNALVFLYKQVLQKEPGRFDSFTRAKTRERLPVVLTPGEATQIIQQMAPPWRLMALLLYGSGLRVMECLRLRIKDIDFGYRQMVVRCGKGAKDRITVLPENAIESLKKQFAASRGLHEADRCGGIPGVELPYALERKYPAAGSEWGWFWVFPAPGLSTDPRSGWCAGIMCIRRCFRGLYAGRPGRPPSPSRRRLTPFGIPLPRISSNGVTTSGQCRNCWGTRTFRRR
ncbi:MAG: hypothetical protein RLZZ142_420 [Verrucomicrobiota bacterium]